MKKEEYFLQALRDECWRHLDWSLFAFSLTYNDDMSLTSAANLPESQDSALFRDTTGYYTFVNGDREYIDGVSPDVPLFQFREPISIKKGELANVNRDVETTYGQAMLNAILLIGPLGNKVDYLSGELTPDVIKEKIIPFVVNDPEPGKPRDPNAIYVSELKTHLTHVSHLSGFETLVVPSATPYNLVTHPDMPKLKKRLLEENKNNLGDPAVIARMDAEFAALDRAWLDTDPEKGFFYKAKSFDVARKKMYSFYGAEYSFSGDGTISTITNSLSEGMDINHFPAVVNTSRDGSFNRGAMTALGGVAVDTFQRAFQNSKIAVHDCKTTVSWEIIVDDNTIKWLSDRYELVNGKTIKIDPKGLGKRKGQTLLLRSPGYCHASEANYCAICMGDAPAQTPEALSAQSGAVGSGFMTTFMGMMHGKALKLKRLTLTDIIK